eukprot:c25936_g1_i1 orf=357-1994(+)
MPAAMTILSCPHVGMPLPAYCLLPNNLAESSSKHYCALSYPFCSNVGSVWCSSVSKEAGVKLSGSKHLSYFRRRGFGLRLLAGLSSVADDSVTDSSQTSNYCVLYAVNAVAPVMKRGYGAFGGATLEKAKLDLSQSTTRSSPQTEDGGSGGDIGNKINHGGGDGGDDGGDDDDYFGDADDADDEDEGFFRRRLAIPELFDRKIVEAILHEWYRTITDLPAGLRQAVEMNVISSVQMARFMAINARPTLARFISRLVPPSISRAFVGRILADPGFLHKMFWEQAITIGHGVWWEVQHRRERLKDEWDLAALNILTLSICNATIVWSLAPCRSYGNTFKFNLQNAIQKLPHNIFERSYMLREFDLLKRVQSFIYKAGELCLVGMLVGTAGGSLSKIVASRKKSMQLSTPSVRTSALSYGAFLGLSGNLRYQFVYGADRVMRQHFDNLGFVVLCSCALRFLNIHIGDVTRLSWLGLETIPLMETQSLQSAYQRPSLATETPLNGWSVPTEIFPLGFFGGKEDTKKQRQEKPTRTPARRKVKRKVMHAS